MSRSVARAVALASLPGLFQAGAICAQNRGGSVPIPRRVVLADSSVHAIVRFQRQQGNAGRPEAWQESSILRQRGTPHSRVRLDSLADSIAAAAITAPSPPSPDAEIALWAVVGLQVAGQPTGPGNPGIPYAGALDRLIRIHREARDTLRRASALAGLLKVVDRPRALAYLAQVAASADPVAWAAMNQLTMESRSARAADVDSALYAMWQGRRPLNRAAAMILDAYAKGKSWRAPSPPPNTPDRLEDQTTIDIHARADNVRLNAELSRPPLERGRPRSITAPAGLRNDGADLDTE